MTDLFPSTPDKKLWPGFVAGITTILFCATGQGAFLFLMVTYLEHMQVPISENGLLKAFLALVEGATCLLVGFLYRGKHARLIIAVSTVFMAAGSLIYVVQPLGFLVWVATAVNAIGIGVLILIPYVATLARRPDSLSLGLAVGFFTAAIAGGNSAGAVIAGAITSQSGFPTAFAVSAAIMILILPASFFLGKITNSTHANTPQTIPEADKDQPTGWLWKMGIIAGFTLSSVNVVFDTLFPIYGLRGGMSIAMVGTLTGVKMLLAAVIRPFSGAIMSRLNGLRLNNWSISILAGATVVMPLVGMGAGLFLLVGIMGLAFGTARVTTATLSLHGQNSPRLTSQRSSIYNTMMSIGQIIGPWMAGLAAELVNPSAALVSLPILFMAVYGISAVFLPRIQWRSLKTWFKTV